MKIEIWSDVVCPFCYIGKRHLEIAMENTGLKNEVEIEWKSFQLDPHARPSEGQTLYDYLSACKGMSPDQVKNMTNQVVERAAAVGLNFDFDKAIVANTEKAHYVMHFAKERGLQLEMKERFLRAYFTEGMDLNDVDVLADLAVEVGLDRKEVLASIESDKAALGFREDVQLARDFRISGVPFIVIDRKYAVSGAQPISTFENVLKEVAAEATPTQEESADSCAVDDPNC
ncbi:DsbA family oxidoreductase [Phaeocystidibacter luteus]|uniref:DsbA family oxidoreductase n=1 Tax=Phaeocystidibacter luteus TaxID=911197 RepID=A0A6N6RLR5_9FLAO|nr:DsbA family oxidoreductase [Phaeocystidibacter luteus]KAB2814515.1 DsbA family oxidoreductase [Phaeocystidibacter luteus]